MTGRGAGRALPAGVVSAGTVRSGAVLALSGEVLVVAAAGLAVGWWDWRAGAVVAVVVALLVGRQVAATGTSVVRARLRVRTVDRRTGWPAGWAAFVPGRTVTVNLGKGRDPVRTVPVAVPAVTTASDPWGVGQPPPVLVVLVVAGGAPLELTGPTVVGIRPKAPAGWAAATLVDLSRTVSRTHLMLEPADDGVWVTDAGSTNGTAVGAPGIPATELPPRVRTFVGFGWVLVLGVRQMQVLHPAQAAALGWSAGWSA